jgi:hypothetical protein
MWGAQSSPGWRHSVTTWPQTSGTSKPQREGMGPPSRGVNRPSFASSWTLFIIGGRRESRVPIAPMGPVQQKARG